MQILVSLTAERERAGPLSLRALAAKESDMKHEHTAVWEQGMDQLTCITKKYFIT